MDSSSIERIKQLFDQLIALPDTQRESWLAAQIGVDEATRRYVHGLLAADARVGDMTAWPALRPDAKPADWLGRRIGPYEVVSELGRGGMGSVFLARRVDGGVEQQVAIKIVRPERVDASTLARFRLERQVLALLQHPNIAAMLDLGELPDGSPYAVMEYVDGTPLGDYIQQQSPDLRQRLDLFLQLCDAVAYAHSSMVVHRDLKPGNVLIDRKGRPRLLDFGIAKPLLSRLGAIDVEETALENRFFSPAHAAPEQLREDGRIGAACDVYGLGTLLYQLLAGVPPFVLDGRSLAELERDILEKDPPPPSRRNRDSGLTISRDLDLITLRCLRKDPADRYASVDQLAADVRNYLVGRPVMARDGNTLYRLGRFASRHRLAVTMSAALLGSAVIGAALVWHQQLATLAQRTRAEEMSTLIADAVASLDPNSSKRDLSAREMFELVAAQVRNNPELSPESRARVLNAIASIDLDLGLPKQAEKLLQAVDTSLLSDDERERAALTKVRTLQYLELRQETLHEITAAKIRITDPRQRVPWLFMEAETHYMNGNIEATLRLLGELDPALLNAHQNDQRLSLRALAKMHSTDQKLRDQAYGDLESLLEDQKKRLGPDSPAVISTLGKMQVIHFRAGRLDEAEALGTQQLEAAERVFGRNSMRYADALVSSSQLAGHKEDYARAIELQLQAQAIYKAELGDSTAYMARSYFNLAGFYAASGNRKEADRYFRQAAELAGRLWLPTDLNVTFFRTLAAVHLYGSGEFTDAHALIRAALVDINAHPSLQEFDITPLAEAVARLCEFHDKPNADSRLAAEKGLRFILDNAASRSTKRAAEQLKESAAKQGIAPAPPEPAAEEK